MFKRLVRITIIITCIFAAIAGIILNRYEIHYKKVPYNIDKIYIINLDHRKDKWERIERRLKKNNITNYQRFSAVDGYEVKIYNERTGETFTGRDLKDKRKRFVVGESYKILCPNLTFHYEYMPKLRRGTHLSAGELGAYCSHLEVLQNIIRRKYRSAVVFEDDALLTNDFSAKLDALTHSLVKLNKWDLIYLGYVIGERTKRERNLKLDHVFLNKYLKKINNKRVPVWLTHAYLTNALGAEKILRNISHQGGYDLDISDIIEQDKLKAYVSTTINLTQAGESDISKMGR